MSDMPSRPGSQAGTLGIIALGLVAVAAAIAWLVLHRHPAAGWSVATPAPAPLSGEQVSASAGPPPPLDSAPPKRALPPATECLIRKEKGVS